MNSNEILARLREGENIDSIAKELTEALNAAKRDYEEEQASAKRKAENKRRDAQEICDVVNAFMANYYSDVPNNEPIDADTFIALVDSIASVFRSVKKVEEKVSPVVKKTKDDFDDAIEDFLNKFVR